MSQRPLHPQIDRQGEGLFRNAPKIPLPPRPLAALGAFALGVMICCGWRIGGSGVQAAQAEELPIAGMEKVTIVEKLGEKVSPELQFTDHEGRTVKLGEWFGGDKPILLTLNYYRCPMLCNLQLNALTKGLKELEWTAGSEFRIVTVSIDARETSEDAKAKRRTHLADLSRGEVDWSFLVGHESAITALAHSVGYGFKYLPERDEFAHTAAIFMLSPDGRVMRYLYGLEYPARDLKFALIEASEGRAGSAVERLLLSCFVYDHTEGAYGPYAFGIMRAGAALTAIALAFVLSVFWLRERRQMSRTEVFQG